MNKNEEMLSLGNWPIRSIPNSTINLSPSTARVLQSVKIQVHNILPQTLVDFKLDNQLQNMNESYILQLYEQGEKRKRKVIRMLKEFWNQKSVLKTNKPKSSKIKSLYSERNRTKSSSHKSITKNSRISLKIETAKHKTKNKNQPPLLMKNSNVYSDYYCLSRYDHIEQKPSNQDESTMSRRRSNGQKNTQYYRQNSLKKVKKKKSLNKTDLANIMALNTIMQKWMVLDQKHASQNLSLINVDDHEKRRLLKIHKIEKDQLRMQFKQTKEKLKTKYIQSTILF